MVSTAHLHARPAAVFNSKAFKEKFWSLSSLFPHIAEAISRHFLRAWYQLR